MKYRKWTLEQKRAIVKKFYLTNRNWQQTTREANISDGLLRYWLADEDINPDKDYAKKLRSRLKVKLAERKAPTDPLPNGVEMASVNNPDELLRENKDLRKKIAYLEDKVAYLTELYKVISEEPEKILKKNGSSRSGDLSKLDIRI
jgi:hypothetical protein